MASKFKLMLVDDEEDFLITFAERLRMRKYNTRTAVSGEQALDIIKKETFDVVVSDLRMPGIDGLELLKSIKEFAREIQVIILTGHGSDREEEKAMSLGAFSYVRKPVDLKGIIEIMESAYLFKRELAACSL